MNPLHPVRPPHLSLPRCPRLILPFLPHCRKRKTRPQALETRPGRSPPGWLSVSITAALFFSLSWSCPLSELPGKPPENGPGQGPWSSAGDKAKEGASTCGGVLPSLFSVSPGIEGGFDLSEKKFDYDEDVKIVILPDYLEIARDGLGGLPDIVRDRVQISFPPTPAPRRF